MGCKIFLRNLRFKNRLSPVARPIASSDGVSREPMHRFFVVGIPWVYLLIGFIRKTSTAPVWKNDEKGTSVTFCLIYGTISCFGRTNHPRKIAHRIVSPRSTAFCQAVHAFHTNVKKRDHNKLKVSHCD